MIERKYNKKLYPKCFDEKEIRALEKMMDEVKQIAVDCVEINIDNYDKSQVEEINNAMIYIHSILSIQEKL